MSALLQDLRYGARMLYKRPGFTLIAILSIAIGISANTTIFSWVQAVMLNPIPGVTQADRLITIETLTPSGEFIDASYPDYRDYRDRTTMLSGVALFKERPLAMGQEQASERIWVEMVSGNFFEVLGVTPILGRFYSPEEQEEKPGASPVVVISEPLWRTRFDSDLDIVGQTVLLNRHECTIIGVAPAAFAGTIGGLRFDMWVPIMMKTLLTGGDDEWINERGNRPFHLIGRLNPGVTVNQAQAEIKTISTQLASSYPNSNEGIGATVLSIPETPYGAQSLMSGMLTLLMGGVGVVMLIVCANVANLFLARSTARRKEVNIRFALGANRRRIIKQIMTESVLMSIGGGVVGVIFSFWMVDLLSFFIPVSDMPVSLTLAPDGTVLGFTLLLVLLAGVLVGLAPAIQATRGPMQDALKQSSRGLTAGSQSQWMRSGLVITEVALASIALICAGLFVQSFENAKKIDPGFDPDQVMLAGFNLSTHGYSRIEGLTFFDRLQTDLAAAPGVEGVSFAETVPLGFDKGSWQDIEVAGYVPDPNENMKIYRNSITPGYFDVMQMPLSEGRDFNVQDDQDSRRVMIVNEAFVRRFLPGRNPIGRQVIWWGGSRRMEIVGVVRDIKHHQLSEPPKPFMYVPLRQHYFTNMSIAAHVRTKGAPEQIVPAIKQAVRAIDPIVDIYETMPLTAWIGAAYFVQRIAAMLLSVMGGIALLLAGLGLYSVMAYAVTLRTQEIGIRMALGAQPQHVMNMVIRQGMFLVLIGLVIGLAGALGSTRLLMSLLYGISATDPLTFVGITLLLSGVALLASYLPARKAMRVDPIVALRHE